jgi:uncharacterized protein YneF (UPF0154 family)
MNGWLILILVGAAFVVLGVIGIFWGMREEKRIFEELSKKPDLREFSMRHVETPQPGSLKTGGWIAIALGVVLVVVGLIFWHIGWPGD